MAQGSSTSVSALSPWHCETETGKKTPCWLRVLFAVKNKFLFVLCVFDPAPVGLKYSGGGASGCIFASDWMYAGRTQAGSESGYMPAPDWP